MMLPELDGTGVLKQLKEDPSTAQIPVIVLTSLSQRNEEKLKEAGATAYLEKSLLNLDHNAEPLIQVVEEAAGPQSEAGAKRVRRQSVSRIESLFKK
jgi:CheY-like chemotaxis protein